ncbi:hypothetical protein R3W88_000005 [Solanum pinnatisectum]|uniref:Uncharacterized protein n=1 Tax=Solanum pinnatisectum TaxID=50273 RepID=A0AAV9MER3_9SOLN|nr:hypothetical protein R3W88_000005 [Solanum pinnatisectum]
MDLLLDPDPDNIVAVGLTGLLTWASVSILWQLFVKKKKKKRYHLKIKKNDKKKS